MFRNTMKSAIAIRHSAFLTNTLGVSLRPNRYHSLSPRTNHTYKRPSSRTRLPFRIICAHASTSNDTSTSERLAALRSQLRERGFWAMVVPSGDPHSSEYAPACYSRRAFISSFDGSAGTAVITLEGAHLWTDGRYFLQAEQQLDENWTLMRAGLPETPTISAFLADNAPSGAAIAIDPFTHSIDHAKAISDALEEAGQDANIVPIQSPNPVDVVWGKERPPFPNGFVRVHTKQFAGASITEKLTSLREEMEKKECKYMLLSMLDEVCWVYNIRGTDIPHCPVVLSYALIHEKGAFLYVDAEKLDAEVEDELSAAEVEIRPYESVVKDVRSIAQSGDRIWLDPASTSLAISGAAGESSLLETTPVPLAKACKNEMELKGMQEAHIRDGLALSSFLCWLEDYVNDNDKAISEVDAARKLEEFRASQDGFLSTSFTTIAGSGANGAIIHYSPQPGLCGNITNKEVFLLDSGGQYEDGTTDVTRTMHLGGTASEHEKECFTRVLQGHIAIDTAVFPEDTTGFMLDTLARIPLWNIGLDYRHGTGHGVGACLNVHEGPQSISPRISSNKAALKEGMILSNEPGYYEDGNFGIRIENLLYVVKKNTLHGFGGKDYLGFKRLTHVPFDKSMIIPALLSPSEIEWIDNYHQDIWDKLSPRMQDGRYKDWLREKTSPILGGKQLNTNNRVASQALANGSTL